MDRDTVLAAALGAAVLTGCTPSARPAPTSSPSPTPPPPVDPDVAVLTSWSLAERALYVRYGPAVRLVPALKPLRANHLARASAVADHLRVRGVRVPVLPAPTRPRGAAAAQVSRLASEERAFATACLAALAGVRDPKVAVLGAELVAGARQHAALLRLVR